jgi:hypothetical protein
MHHLLHPQNAAGIATVGAVAAYACLATNCSRPSSVAHPWDASLFATNQPNRGPPTDQLILPRLTLSLPPLDSSVLPDRSNVTGPPSPAGAAHSGLDSAGGDADPVGQRRIR